MVELLLEGRKRVRKIAPSRRSWTRAKERTFLEALAESCNVKLAAKKAGVSASAIYVRRSRDASFRRAWDQALSAGYAQLEMMMLERALHGVEKTVVLRSGETKVMREYSDRVGLALLRMHRDSAAAADESVDAEDYQEACDRIMARLERLREREDEVPPTASRRVPLYSTTGEGLIETKSAVDRIEMIRWALGAPWTPASAGVQV